MTFFSVIISICFANLDITSKNYLTQELKIILGSIIWNGRFYYYFTASLFCLI